MRLSKPTCDQWLDVAKNRGLCDHRYRTIIYLLVKLSSFTKMLPRSLFITGINIESNEESFYENRGGYAAIYKGTWGGQVVAVKRLHKLPVCNDKLWQVCPVID
jgi:hypothetical protein